MSTVSIVPNETKLLKIIETDEFQNLLKKHKITIRRQVMNVGDVLVESSNHKHKILIERKTISDWNASIIDGRLFNQFNRLIKLPEDFSIVYIIENCGSIGTIQNELVESSVESFLLKYGCRAKLMYSQSLEHTIKKIIRVASKFDKFIECSCLCSKCKNVEEITKREDDANKIVTLNQPKIGGLKQDDFWRDTLSGILSSIPGVSISTAQAISRFYDSSFEKFYNDLVNSSDNLSLIQKSSKTKIGTNLSKKIRSCFLSN